MKLLIVDDEEQIREGIKRFISKLKLPITEIQTACDGVEALEYVNSSQPDIIISDVVMPGMDGIQLLRSIKEQNSAVKAIMISGYSDLNYLKSAFKVDAIDYILKPVNIQELESVLTSVVHELEESKKDQVLQASLKKKYEESLPVLKAKFLSDLINGLLAKTTDLLVKLESLGLAHAIDTDHVVMDIIIDDEDSSIQADIIELIGSIEKENNFFRDAVAFGAQENEIIIVAFTDDLARINTLANSFITSVQRKVSANFGISLSAGISKPGNSLQDVPESYKQAAEAVSQCFIFGLGNVVFYATICERDELTFILTGEVEKKLISCLYSGDAQGIKSALSTLFSDFSKQDYKVTNQRILQIKIGLAGFVQRLLYDMDLDCEREFADMDWSVVAKLESLDGIRNWLDNLLISICADTMQRRRNKSTIIAERVKAILNEKYNQPIGVQTVADELKISNNYLSAIFKQHAGISFTSYLTKIRLAKAKELIEHSLLKIHEIASLVGYEDHNYFSRVFRREFGISPTEIREVHR